MVYFKRAEFWHRTPSYAPPVDTTTRDAAVVEALQTVVAANPKIPGIY